MNNKAKWKNYTKEEILQIVNNSISNREVAKKLGYSLNGGGTISTIKKMYEELDISTEHFKGQGWNKENYNYNSFNENSYKKRGKYTINPLIKLRGRKCEMCGLSKWNEKPINLEVHHINGDRTDNRLENLQLLCPNCHSYTYNFCKRKNKIVIPDDKFVKSLQENNSIRQALIHLGLNASGGNYDRAYGLIEKYNIKHLKH